LPSAGFRLDGSRAERFAGHETHHADRNTPAYLAARGFMRGVNIANYLEVPPGEHWDTPHSVEDLELIRAEGFDHIRLPVGWHHYTGPAPDFKVSEKSSPKRTKW
jgi:hypothetical protein